jgi:hypothetical protein
MTWREAVLAASWGRGPGVRGSTSGARGGTSDIKAPPPPKKNQKTLSLSHFSKV